MPNGITDQTLANLRTTAALLLVCPGLVATGGVDGRAVVEARRPPVPEADHPIIPVCAFHRCVAKAHDLRRSGQQVQMVGVEGDREPFIALVAEDDALRMIPGGVVRRCVDDRWYHLLSVSLPVEAIEEFAADVVAATGIDIVLHADRMLDVTVLVTDTPRGDKRVARDAIDAIEQVAAMATVEWMLARLAPGDVDAGITALLADGDRARVAPGRRPR